jgi:hypothetical protein
MMVKKKFRKVVTWKNQDWRILEITLFIVMFAEIFFNLMVVFCDAHEWARKIALLTFGYNLVILAFVIILMLFIGEKFHREVYWEEL